MLDAKIDLRSAAQAVKQQALRTDTEKIIPGEHLGRASRGPFRSQKRWRLAGSAEWGKSCPTIPVSGTIPAAISKVTEVCRSTHQLLPAVSAVDTFRRCGPGGSRHWLARWPLARNFAVGNDYVAAARVCRRCFHRDPISRRRLARSRERPR